MKRRVRLGSSLAMLGQKAGLATAVERAAAIGFSRSHLLHVERGDFQPSAAMLDAMSAAYNVHVDVLQRAANHCVETLARRKLEQLRGIE